jgi:small-conductance mechanosensitive channel
MPMFSHSAPLLQATGVPLVDELLAFTTLQDAAAYSIKLAIVAAIAIYLGSKILDVVNDRLPKPEDQGKGGRGFIILPSLVKAGAKPASALLPFYGAAYLATLASSLTQVAAMRMGAEWNGLFGGRGAQILAGLKWMTQFLQDASEVVLIAGATWTAVRLKGYLFAYACNLAGGPESRAARILNPVSSVLTWVIYFMGFTSALAAAGINVTPLVGSIGGAGVIIGLAAQ